MVERGRRKGSKRSPKLSVNTRATQKWLSVAASLLTAFFVARALFSTDGLQFLSPGPLISGHRAIKDCSTCHTQSKPGKFGWIERIARDNSTEDVQACIACHKVNGDVRYAHTAQKRELETAQQRRLKIAGQVPKPLSAKARNLMFPKLHLRMRNLLCVNCHQEHQGVDFNLEAISNDQCQACHALQFDSFDGNHPAFENYPFKRRTRLIYDHAAHFTRYFPETMQKNPQSNIPNACSNCHTSQKDRRYMMLTSFDQTCSGCHIDGIFGKKRISGPKGIAFLTLPGVDVTSLRERNAEIGAWPEFSEAEVTPFMKVLISRNQEGIELLKTIDKLDLMDLSQATDQEIETVTRFIWEIKGLFYALVSGPASDVMAKFAPRHQGIEYQRWISNLTAGLPREVIVAAQREWLPALGTEMASHADAARESWVSSNSERRLSGSVAPDELLSFRLSDKVGATETNVRDSRRLAQADNPAEVWRVDPFGHIIGEDEPSEVEESAATAGHTDDVPPSEAPLVAPSVPAIVPIDSDVDAETWAEYGGWYRQDYAILYRPVGHKDPFIRSWLDLTGPYAPESETNSATRIFDLLAVKGAQGECVKCHSVDSIPGKGRKVNWSPGSPKNKHGRFTTFIHEPHFGVMKNKGCLTCHKLQTDTPYSKTFEQGNPQRFVSGFSQVDKALCQTCHTRGAAQQNCMLCHKYHINGIVTPMIETQLPQQ